MFPQLKDLIKEDLIDILQDAVKNWFAHDGLWFQKVEKEFRIDIAIECDATTWNVAHWF